MEENIAFFGPALQIVDEVSAKQSILQVYYTAYRDAPY